jgi:hypothetical protein
MRAEFRVFTGWTKRRFANSAGRQRTLSVSPSPPHPLSTPLGADGLLIVRQDSPPATLAHALVHRGGAFPGSDAQIAYRYRYLIHDPLSHNEDGLPLAEDFSAPRAMISN